MPSVKRLVVWEDAGGKWRWKVKAANNRETAGSEESFASHRNALKAGTREHPGLPVETLHQSGLRELKTQTVKPVGGIL